jgi:hypothetical protein
MESLISQRIEATNEPLENAFQRLLSASAEDSEEGVDDVEPEQLEPERESEEDEFVIREALIEDSFMSPQLQELMRSAKALDDESLDDVELRALLRKRLRFRNLLESLEENVLERIPSVVHFRSFEDELPDSISLGEDHELPDIVEDFCALSGLKIEQLQAARSPQERKYIVEEATKVYSRDFGRFWRQENLTVGVDVDGNKLVFLVRGDGEPHSYAPSQRSKGLKWYTSFFIALSARGKGLGSAIVMIDEPGLYLHASAQADLLRLLEDMADNNYQILFATHSPYLISTDRLDRVRPVYKSPITKRTEVKNAWYLLQSNGDESERDIQETLTPLITAMGLDVAKGFPGISRGLNVIVEGPTDYFYLVAMNEVLCRLSRSALSKGAAFVPCLGHTNVGMLLSLLVGWGLQCVVVLDRKGTKRTKKLLIEQGYPEDRLIGVGPRTNSSTADLFSPRDAKRFIIPDDYKVPAGQRMSAVLKSVPGVSETVLARRFLDRIMRGEQLDLTGVTLDSFEKLFSRIAEAVGNHRSENEVAAGTE